MGTRSLTVFHEHDKEIVVMYRQMDGYPSGHGLELSEFLAGGKMVNGLGMTPAAVFNGMGCLAAQVVANFKKEPGNFYLYPAGSRDCGEEFVYVIKGDTGKEPIITVFDAGWEDHSDKRLYTQLFEGTATEAKEWCKKN